MPIEQAETPTMKPSSRFPTSIGIEALGVKKEDDGVYPFRCLRSGQEGWGVREDPLFGMLLDDTGWKKHMEILRFFEKLADGFLVWWIR